MTWVTLTDVEQRLAKFLAKERYRVNRERGIENRRVGPQDDVQTEIEGIGAELAFCRIVNVYPDLQIGVMPNGDALLINGCMVDVKSTRYSAGKLLAVPSKIKHPPDLYALMVGEFPRYRCAGITTAERLLDAANIVDLGHGDTYAMVQDQLDHITDIAAGRRRGNGHGGSPE